MKARASLLFLIALLMVMSSCTDLNKTAFNKNGWATKDDWDYPDRDGMLDDLIKNHEIKGFSYKQMVQLLGEPQGKDSFTVFYQVIMDFGSDIDPVYTKNLEVTFNQDSIINSVAIKEWKKP